MEHTRLSLSSVGELPLIGKLVSWGNDFFFFFFVRRNFDNNLPPPEELNSLLPVSA